MFLSKFYNKYVVIKKGKFQEEKDDGIFLSPREYINRINLYSEFNFQLVNQKLEKIEHQTRLKKEKEDIPQIHTPIFRVNLNDKKTFLIYDYHRIIDLGAGEMFGDQALSGILSRGQWQMGQ